MKKIQLLLAALILSLSGVASAGVPIIKLNVTDSIHGLVDYDSFNFSIGNGEAGLYKATLNLLPKQAQATDIIFGIEKEGSKLFNIVGAKIGAGSFSFNATVGKYFAFVVGSNLSHSTLPYHLTVSSISPVPEPRTWAMLMLGMGFVVYQSIRRKRSGTAIQLR